MKTHLAWSVLLLFFSTCFFSLCCFSCLENSSTNLAVDGDSVDGDSVEADQSDEQWCETEEDCADWDDIDRTCLNYKCVNKSCRYDADCSGYFNECSGGFCRHIDYFCETDLECPSDKYCSETGFCIGCHCYTNSDCTANRKCNGCYCVECTKDSHCPNDTVCVDQKCVECRNNNQCQDGYCKENKCHTCKCFDDSDCGIADECIDCMCQAISCNWDFDCPEGSYCYCDYCHEIICHDFTIAIDTESFFLAEGESVIVKARLLDEDGNVIIYSPHSNNFYWSINNDCATLEPDYTSDSATLTGTDKPGPVELSLSFYFFENPCEYSASFTFYNYSKPAQIDSQVVVYNSLTGEALENIPVILKSSSSKSANSRILTNSKGAATFFGLNCLSATCDLHVLADDYNYVSAFGLNSNHILIPLQPNKNLKKAGGAKGHVNNSEIPYLIRDDTFLSYASFAYPGNLMDLSFDDIAGERKNTLIQIGGTIDEWLKLPIGTEACLNPDQNKGKLEFTNGFLSTGNSHVQTIWALGGFTSLGDILDIFTPLLQGDELQIETLIQAIMPIFSNFYHGIVPSVDYEVHDTIKDEKDFNGDGNTDELIPDYDKYTDLKYGLSVYQAQTQDALINEREIPKTGESCLFDSAINIVGTIENNSFIPLGFNISLDSILDENNESISDCKLDDTDIYYAPKHSGFQYNSNYYTISIMMNIKDYFENFSITKSAEAEKKDVSITIQKSDSIPTYIELPDTIYPMTDNIFDQSTHTLQTPDIENADYHRAVFFVKDIDSKRYWQVYWKNGNGFSLDFDSLGISDDRTMNFEENATLQAVDLEQNLDYDKIFTLNGKNLDKLNNLVLSYSSAEMHKAPETSEK